MINLSAYLKNINLWRRAVDEKASLVEVISLNIDNIFFELKNMGVEEIKVDEEQMLLICRFLSGFSKESESLEILKEGKVDKFLGIKLK